MPATFTIELTSAAQRDKLIAELKNGNLTRNPNAGLITGVLPEISGVQLMFSEEVALPNGNIPVLFTILHKPFYVPDSAIIAHVKQMINEV